MLDMGFRPAVDRIVALTPDDRQTLFFSATLEGAVGKVARDYTQKPRSHTHTPPETAAADIAHRFLRVESQGAKLDQLVASLEAEEPGRSLVFVRTKRGADRLVKRLRNQDVEAVAMHGDKTQRQRENALARFERGEVMTLVATDVAARGIDVPDVVRVFNYDAPEDRAAYVHRIGRTGRAGRTGTGISFVLGDEVGEMRKIAKSLDLAFDLKPGTATGTATTRPRAEEPKHEQQGRSHKGHGKPRQSGEKRHAAAKEPRVTDGPRRKRRRRRRKPAATAS
jgi:superfamily II DNA/RNA helicase